MSMKIIDFAKIEKKWQRKWEKEKAFEVSENRGKKKYYVLEQFPYPSGTGLHVGHAFIYSLGDIYARFKRMQGFNVLYPIGFDSFGLPAENAAIKAKAHPKKFTEAAIKNFICHFKSFGNSYDWTRELECHRPDYYKWDQWIFLKMVEKDLAYRKTANVNWCKKCNTVLANEQVHNGKCWRHEDMEVENKELDQWFLRITKYADELYENLNKLDKWPGMIKKLQKNWIGKSHGTEIVFDVSRKEWKVFTTRPDTLFGVTFLIVSIKHEKLKELVTEENKGQVKKLLKKVIGTKEEDKGKLEKEGVFTGSYGEHPLTGEKIPIWTGNFVLPDYGSGMVMAVPGHDQRDYEFAKKYKLKIKDVVKGDSAEKGKAFTGYGVLVNSEGFDGLKSVEAMEHITNALNIKKKGKKTTQFRLRDWLISRQRFWGTPIPIIYCDDCGVVPVPEKDLPVKLPDNLKFESVENPLVKNEKFVNVKCPKCGKKGRRETDTMDTFANSSWYYLRFCDPKNGKKIFDSKKADYWMPIDIYIGGKEHACMHDIYFRFYNMFLNDIGLVKEREPAVSLFNQGFVNGEDGRKMSKSLGNVKIPGNVAKKYGVDGTRLFLMSVSSPDKDFNWNDKGAEGSLKFILKLMNFVSKFKDKKMSKLGESKFNRTVKEYTKDIENFRYNLAVIKLRSLFDILEDGCDKKRMQEFVKMLSIFCPHVAEEMWNSLGGEGFVSLAKWPKHEEKKINDKLEEEEKIVEKTIEDVKNILKIVKKKVKKIYIYVLPQELKIYDGNVLSEKIGLETRVFSVSDKKKYDPDGKSKKVKPGRPAIFVE